MNGESSGKVAPGSLATEFISHTGERIRTRLIRPEDAPLLVDLFHHLSPETRRRRFHINLEKIEEKRIWETARALAGVDNRTDGGAVLAFADRAGRPRLVGVARLARLQDRPHSPTAEVAVVVRDDYQGQGIGVHLMALLFELARQMNVATITATVQADNEPVRAMLRGLDLPVQTHTSHGETEVRITLDA